MESKKKFSIALMSLSILIIVLAIIFLIAPEISPIPEKNINILIAVIGFLGVILSKVMGAIIPLSFLSEKSNDKNNEGSEEANKTRGSIVENSKNVVIGSDIKAGRDVHIGDKVKKNKTVGDISKLKIEGGIHGTGHFIVVGGKVKIDSEKRIDTPVPRNKLNKFIALVEIKAIEYEQNPANPPSIEGDLRFYLDETVKFSSYQKEKPLEVAMLYRLYSSIYLLMEVSSNKNWGIAFQNVKNILKYSVQLFEENLDNKLYTNEAYYKKVINKFPQFKNAVNRLEKVFDSFDSDRITPDILKEVILNNLILAMPTKELSVIESRADLISRALTGQGGVTSYTKHLNFLINIKNSNHQKLGEAIKLLEKVLTLRNTGDIHYPKNPVNPYYFPNKENGLCRIEYDYQDNGNHIELHWDVSADNGKLIPITPSAKILLEYWRRNFISLDSLKVLLDSRESSELLNSSIKDINSRNFNSAIIKLMKLKIIDNSIPETHWYLSKSLYAAMTMFSSSPKMKELMVKIEGLNRLPIQERERKFQEFLKSSNEGEFQELNRVMTGEYPFWIREELTQYLNKSPNGEFSSQANQLLKGFSNVLPKK